MNNMNDTERLDTARALVLKERIVSISMLQRDLLIGYNAASRLVYELEKEGVVSRMNTTGGRTVMPNAGVPARSNAKRPR